MTATSFIRDPAQAASALVKANQHRFAQAEFKRALVAMTPTAARATLADALEGDVAPEIEATHVFQLLCACPKIGEVKARRVLRIAGVPERKRLRNMTPRQRALVAAEVRRIHEVAA